MRTTTKVEFIRDKYYYETTEKIRICPNCKKEFIGRKRCFDCKTETQEKTKDQTGWISEDLKQFSCSCIFGSWYRWGKKWRDNFPDARCKHCVWAMRIINKKNEIKFEILDKEVHDEDIPSDIPDQDQCGREDESS